MEKTTGRTFNFNAPCTYIERQEINVNDGGRVLFGKPVEEAAALEHCTPDSLNTPAAQALLRKAQEAGWLDDDLQPTCGKEMAALLASRIARILALQPMWTPFEQLWNVPRLSKHNSNAMGRVDANERIEQIDRALK